jgi:ABC-type multidrug transport system permease subunit
MSSVRLNWGAAWAVVRRDFQLFMSYRLRFGSQILSTFFGVALFYYVSQLVSVKQFPSHDAYFAFVVIGLAVLELLTAALHTVPTSLRAELVAGTFERMVVSPFGPLGGIVALSLFPMFLASVMGTLTIGFAALVFGLPIHWQTVPLAVPALLLGMFAFLPLALLLAGVVLIVKQAGSLAAFVVSGLSLTAGAFFPVVLLPAALHWISKVQPLTPALELARHELVGAPISGSAWAAAGKLAAWGIVLLPISILSISHAIGVCQRRGTLIEY